LRDNRNIKNINYNLHHFPQEENMSRKNIGYGLLVVGILVIAVSLLADLLGIGSGAHKLVLSQIGWHQWLGAAIGLVIAAVGVFLSFRRK
jgi:uncharacterized membrane protein